MTILLGIDPATRLGWASYEDLGKGRDPRIRCGTFTATGAYEHEIFADFARQFRALLDEVKPRRIAIEQRLPSLAEKVVADPNSMLPGATRRVSIRNDNNSKRQDGMRGIMLAQLGARRPSQGLPNGIPFDEVHSSSWRGSFFGKEHRPPARIPPERRRAWWKAEASLKANMLGSRLGFVVPNADAAEALGIVFWLAAREGLFAARDAVRTAAA